MYLILELFILLKLLEPYLSCQDFFGDSKFDETPKKSDLDGFVKSSNSRRANFVIMRRTFRTLNDCEMQHNAEVGLFTKPSSFSRFSRDTPRRYAAPKSNASLLQNHIKTLDKPSQ